MTVWTAAMAALLPALALPMAVACRGGTGSRLAAVQLVSSLTAWILVLMTFVFDQSSFIDLPLALAMLSLPGTLVLTLFLERWL